MVLKDHVEKGKENGAKAEKSRRTILNGLIWSCAAELKLLLTFLLLLCSLATFLQLIPLRFPFFSPTPSCLTVTTNVSEPVHGQSNLHVDQQPEEVLLDNGIIKRSFQPLGVAAYSFILMSAYRGGASTFAVNGLASKPLHVFGKPTFTCEYESPDDNITSVSVPGYAMLPDWGYGRVYTTVVINCTFPSSASSPVSDSSVGGKLLIHVNTNGGFDADVNDTQTVQALDELPNSWNLDHFVSSPKYDYLYCGSPLYGDLSPQRVREWIAYHARLFGNKSHFVIHDAGGVHADVVEVLRPWMEKGYVTLHDIREQERFDAYYHNQFLVVNDCLHRYKFDAKWMFFFDVDEFIHVNPVMSLSSAMDSFEGFTQILIEQMPMSNKLCLSEDAGKTSEKWGFEKLVYKNVKKVLRRDRKYAIQPRNVFATGVHLTQNFVGHNTRSTEKRLSYFHYHGTIAEHREPCRHLVNETYVKVEDTPYVLDTTMRMVAPDVKKFELDTIGSRLQRTQQ